MVLKTVAVTMSVNVGQHRFKKREPAFAKGFGVAGSAFAKGFGVAGPLAALTGHAVGRVTKLSSS